MRKTRNTNGMGNVYYNQKTERYEYRKMVDGDLRFASAKTQKELNEKIKTLTDAPMSKEKIKVHDWADKWLSVYVKPMRKASTHKQYEDTIRCYIKPNIKNTLLRSVRPFDAQNIIARMHEQGLSASTMKQARKVLNLMFDKAVKEKLIAENPVKDIEIPDVQQKARKTLKPDEIQTIFDYMQGKRWYWPLRFLLVTGLRRGELLALKWSDIDETNKAITISDNLTAHGIGSTKSNEVHYVPLSDAAMHCLKKFKEQLKKENNVTHWQATGIIFVSQNGTPMLPNSFYNVFRKIRQKTGVQVSPHSMRHTFVYYSKHKLSLSEIKDALGHDETTSTLDIYGTLLANTKEVAAKLDEAFQGIVQDKPQKKAVGTVVEFKGQK